MTNRFRLSSRGRVAAAISLSLVTAQTLWAAGIVPAGADTQVSQAPSGAEVVAIAAPSAAGLSHNRFNDYNVGPAGAVLNNSITGGASQLAGQLGANSALAGRAASVILNEVVTRNPSLLLGKQEIIGPAADLVLANPNGITCNGCGFINTNSASLVVGTAQVADGRLQSLQSARDGTALVIGTEGIAANDVLQLIAPRIDDQGQVRALSGINAISGDVSVDAQSGAVSATAPSVASAALDSAYLGGMQAGRISIVNTAQGAGVNLSGDIHADGSLDVESQGKLTLHGAHLKGDQLRLAGDDVSALALETVSGKDSTDHKDTWVIWKVGGQDSKTSETHSVLDQTRLDGATVELTARHALDLNAVKVTADAIKLRGDSISLEGSVTRQESVQDYAAWKNSWTHNQHTETETQQQIGSQLSAHQDIDLNAQGDVSLHGAELSAGRNLQVQSGKNLQLAGLIEHDRQSDSGSRYLEGDALETGSWNTQENTLRLKPANLNAGGALELSSAGNLNIQGTKLQAGDHLALKSGASVEIAPQLLTQVHSTDEQHVNWGGIGGGARQKDSKTEQQNIGSALVAQGGLTIEAERDIKVIGSQVKGVQGAQAMTHSGNVDIEQATDMTQSLIDERRGGAFNVPLSTQNTSQEQRVAHAAELVSDSHLRVTSGADIEVSGSRVTAQQALELQAGGDIKLKSAELRQREQTRASSLHLGAHAGKDPKEAGQYSAGLGLSYQSDQLAREQLTHTGSALSGASVKVTAGSVLAVNGSSIDARQGDLALSGKQLDVGAVYDQEHSKSGSSTTTLGYELRGGSKRVGSSWTLDGQSSEKALDSRQAEASRVSASGNLTLDTGAGALSTEGAAFSASGGLSVIAGQIDNRAALSQRDESGTRLSWNASVKPSLDYGALVQPVLKVASELKKGEFSAALADGGKIVTAANAGVEKLKQGDLSGALDQIRKVGQPGLAAEMATQGQRQATEQHSVGGNGSQFEGRDLKIQSAGHLSDQGSVYRAGAGQVVIAANSQAFDAIPMETRQSTETQHWDTSLNTSTLTGRDINIHGAGRGGEERHEESNLAQQTGGVMARDGISISLAHNGQFNGARLDAGQGPLQVAAGGDLRLDVAHNRQDSSERQLNGSLGLDLSLSKTGGKPHAQGGSGQVGWDAKGSQQGAQGVEVARLSGAGGVTLGAAGDLSLIGSQIDTRQTDGPAGAVSLSAGARIDLAGATESTAHSAWNTSGEASGGMRAGAPPTGKFDVKVGAEHGAHDGSVLAQVNAGAVTLHSGGDTRIVAGAISAATVAGRVGGDLQVASLNDRDRSDQVTLELGANAADMSKVVSKDGLVMHGKLSKAQSQLESVSTPSQLNGSSALDLQVAGQTTLTGAILDGGSMTPTGGKVALETLPGQASRGHWGAEFSGTPGSVVSQAAKDLLAGKLPLGISHEQSSEDKSTAARHGPL